MQFLLVREMYIVLNINGYIQQTLLRFLQIRIFFFKLNYVFRYFSTD